ncbi:hypothetical protein BHM03_00019519 [Ensete ventricosum]|nr:hypothetical protein BHM03_00019519 [Ensete ventricosum]
MAAKLSVIYRSRCVGATAVIRGPLSTEEEAKHGHEYPYAIHDVRILYNTGKLVHKGDSSFPVPWKPSRVGKLRSWGSFLSFGAAPWRWRRYQPMEKKRENLEIWCCSPNPNLSLVGFLMLRGEISSPHAGFSGRRRFFSPRGEKKCLSVWGEGTRRWALAFDVEYARWLEEHNRQINELRTAVNAHASENDLRVIVDGIMAHYDEKFKLKGVAAKADVFHILSGMWKTPAERCFLWLGGFRSSELLKADNLRQQTLQQMHRILTTRQSARALLAINDYFSRLRALSSLWLARPRE